MPLKDRIYDILRYVANYVLPGLGTLYFALGQIWGLPYGEQIVGTATALVTFLNILLGVSNNAYNKLVELKKEEDAAFEVPKD